MGIVVYTFKTTAPIPNRRQMEQALRNALDAGLVDYRRTALPRHFEYSAPQRYAGEYVKRPGQTKQTVKQLLQAMTPQERAAFYEEFGHLNGTNRQVPRLLSPRVQDALRAARRAGWNSRTRAKNDTRTRAERNAARRKAYANRRKRLPLVHTGYLKSQTLTAAAALVGTAKARRISIPVPGYLYLSQPGTLDKARALQAVRPDEVEQLAKVSDAALQTALTSP